jgi:hypothetical protein
MKVAPMTRRLRRLRHAELPAGAIELARHVIGKTAVHDLHVALAECGAGHSNSSSSSPFTDSGRTPIGDATDAFMAFLTNR